MHMIFPPINDQSLRSRLIDQVTYYAKQLSTPGLLQPGRTVLHRENTLNENLRITIAHPAIIYVQRKAKNIN